MFADYRNNWPHFTEELKELVGKHFVICYLLGFLKNVSINTFFKQGAQALLLCYWCTKGIGTIHGLIMLLSPFHKITPYLKIQSQAWTVLGSGSEIFRTISGLQSSRGWKAVRPVGPFVHHHAVADRCHADFSRISEWRWLPLGHYLGLRWLQDKAGAGTWRVDHRKIRHSQIAIWFD